MESPQINLKDNEEALRSASTSSNQLFISESIELPDDTFRMSLDCISVIGENITIGERDASINNVTNNTEPKTPCNTPLDPETTPTKLTSPPITCETPKRADDAKAGNTTKPHNLLKLSLTKNIDDGFVKPSPVAEVMSPAKMLQFEIDIASSATPTMKRAAIDFNFFNENNFEEYFADVPQVEEANREPKDEDGAKVYKETPVIVKASTVRHEIGYGKLFTVYIYTYMYLLLKNVKKTNKYVVLNIDRPLYLFV